MTHDTDTRADGEAAPEADSFEQAYEAARAAQSDPIGTAEEEAERAVGVERSFLAPEEIHKRWSDTKAALREERRARQAEDQRAAALEQELSVLGTGGRAAPPDPRRDPQATLNYLHERIAEGDAAQEAYRARRREAAEVEALTRDFQNSEADFREAVPDYDNAVAFLRRQRIGELIDQGYSPSDAQAAFHIEALNGLADMRARGKNPAQMAYAIAHERGYGGGQGRPVEAIARGKGAARTLSSSGGRGGGELTYEHVASLSGEAFDAASSG